jgi:hypothetical protein
VSDFDDTRQEQARENAFRACLVPGPSRPFAPSWAKSRVWLPGPASELVLHGI